MQQLLRPAILAFVFTTLLISARAQPAKDYWQQQTDYKIEVSLDDTLHELNGFITITYKNNSPATLNFIYMHLWPNAYKDQTTALAKQMLENGKTKFWYSKPWQKGFIDQLNFKLNAEACKWEFDKNNIDICKLILNQPLKPGESVKISTPFHVKLPETFSRLGHVGQSYQITQWYPKPAVYDKYGWHPIPYLDQGEFYSEFGSFDVSITLPNNYVVGATGDLQDTAEISWMNQLAASSEKVKVWQQDGLMSFPPSSKQLKTLHFKQNNIHDFGWFADKRYHVMKGEVTLPYSKRKVTTWALFTNSNAQNWSNATKYLHDAIQYYSLWIGEYPFNQVTAVDGTISAGGGMEYPNITVIGEEKSAFSLDDVMTHEVGHNWFYGTLGSNERDHAWMDEGINSYYEFRYLKTKYPNQKLAEILPEFAQKALDVNQYDHKYEMDLAYQFMARENYDQPIELTSSKFTELNYFAQVYGKSMLIFAYLEAYLGTENFDAVMKKYYAAWSYKHPQPEDVRYIFEHETGKDLSWFFNDLLGTTKKIDYKIASAKLRVKAATTDTPDSLMVKLKNTGNISSPVPVSLMLKDSVMVTKWVEGFTGTKTIALPGNEGGRVQIDPLLLVPEINRRNNTFKLNKLAHKFERLRFQFIGTIENQQRTQVFFAPYLGWNNYDKTQVGLAFYNPFLPARKFNYLIVPTIGTGSKQFIGFAKFSYNFFPGGLHKFTVGINGKRFSYLLFPKNLTFNKLEPYVNFEFKKKDARSDYSQSLLLRSLNVWQQWIDPTNASDYANNKASWQNYYVNEAHYRLERNSTLHPFDFNIIAQQGNQFMGIWAEGHFKVSYKPKNQGLFIRAFAGGFPLYFKQNSDITAPLPALYLSTAGGNNYAYWLQRDYMYDENFMDRNGRDKNLGKQVAMSGGAFRSVTAFGRTHKFLAATNITSTIYKYVPIQPFASLAVFVDDNNKSRFAAEFGLSAVIVRDMIEIHLPLATTQNIKDNQKILGLTKWYQKFTFTLKFKLVKPIDLVKQFVNQ